MLKKISLLVIVLSLLLISGCLETAGVSEPNYDYDSSDKGMYPASDMYAEDTGSYDSISDAIAGGERIVIKKGSAEIEAGAGKIEEGLVRLKQVISENSGTIENINYYETENTKTYTLEVKLPPANFESFSNGLKSVGNLKSMSTDSEDVTFEYIDLEAKIENLNSQKQRLQALYDKAENVEEILDIEYEINRVQTNIDSSTARKNFLERQVANATLYITLYEEAPIVDRTLIVPLNTAFNTILGAMSISILLISGLVGFAIPIAIIVIILIIIAKALRKHVKGKKNLPAKKK